jgi:hypothetical protein
VYYLAALNGLEDIGRQFAFSSKFSQGGSMMAEFYDGAPSDEVPGEARSMVDLTMEELLAPPPDPSRPEWMVTRFPVDMDEYRALEIKAREPDPAGALEPLDVQVDEESAEIEGNPPEDEALESLAPAALANFDGISQTAFRPPDCTVAVGPNDVMVAVNVDLVGYTKAGVQRFRWANFTALFNPVLPAGATMFDPKLAYDHYANRWIVCIAARRAAPAGSWILLAVSQGSDPAGAYWLWATDARLDGGTVTNNWSDYPMLGFDAQAIYVSTNQFAFGGGFSYAKVRIFNRAELYAGGVGPSHNIRWWDFWGLRNADDTLSFSSQPACHYQGTGGNPPAYLVNALFPGGSALTLWTLGNPVGLWTGGAPSLARVAVACRSYDLPPDALQRDGGTTRIETNDTRLLNALFQSVAGTQRLWTTHTSRVSWPGDAEARSMIQWYEIDVPTKTVVQQNGFGLSGSHYYFPVIQTDIARNAVLAFGRSSANEYGQFRQTGRRVGDAANTLQGSALVKVGEASYNGGRWGDYFGVARDPSDARTIWMSGEYAGTGNTWKTRACSAKY